MLLVEGVKVGSVVLDTCAFLRAASFSSRAFLGADVNAFGYSYAAAAARSPAPLDREGVWTEETY